MPSGLFGPAFSSVVTSGDRHRVALFYVVLLMKMSVPLRIVLDCSKPSSHDFIFHLPTLAYSQLPKLL
jgi:hypothetical protein